MVAYLLKPPVNNPWSSILDIVARLYPETRLPCCTVFRHIIMILRHFLSLVKSWFPRYLLIWCWCWLTDGSPPSVRPRTESWQYGFMFVGSLSSAGSSTGVVLIWIASFWSTDNSLFRFRWFNAPTIGTTWCGELSSSAIGGIQLYSCLVKPDEMEDIVVEDEFDHVSCPG